MPTTGIKLETAALVVLAVIPSTLLLRLPSNDNTPTKRVKIIPNIHIILDLKNFDNLSNCILSEILEIIPSPVDNSKIGIITPFIKFPINVIKNNNIGSTIPALTKLP